MADRTKVLIMGAAGRDFHNFNTYFRDNEAYEVVAFTATQIPYINDRKYPAELAGKLYPDGIRIYDESEMPELVKKHGVEQVVFAYSDVPYEYVMHKSAQVNALGADFLLMGPAKTMVKSTKPVIAVCAVRTGAGKSQTTRKIQTMLREAGKKVVSIRHPMPYGDLVKQRVQRFATVEDLAKHECTIEEMEEYEPHVVAGNVIYAGVDYEAIVREAEKEADVILWDGGNNDFSFYQADLYITVADPHRPGDGLVYYPGEVNIRLADVVVLNKIDTADRAGIDAELAAVRSVNPTARIIMGASPVTVDKPELVIGQEGPRGRGRPHAHARRDEVRRRHRGRQAVRRRRVHRPAAVRRRRDQGDLREVPGRRRAAAGHGLLGAAAQGPGDDHQRLRRRRGRHRHAHGPAPHHRHQAAGRAGHLRPAGDRQPHARRHPPRAQVHLIASV